MRALSGTTPSPSAVFDANVRITSTTSSPNARPLKLAKSKAPGVAGDAGDERFELLLFVASGQDQVGELIKYQQDERQVGLPCLEPSSSHGCLIRRFSCTSLAATARS